jgi:hypothetical protein
VQTTETAFAFSSNRLPIEAGSDCSLSIPNALTLESPSHSRFATPYTRSTASDGPGPISTGVILRSPVPGRLVSIKSDCSSQRKKEAVKSLAGYTKNPSRSDRILRRWIWGRAVTRNAAGPIRALRNSAAVGTSRGVFWRIRTLPRTGTHAVG